MIQRELQQEHTENTWLTYIQEDEYILPLDKFISIIPTNTIIDIFYIILCIYMCMFSITFKTWVRHNNRSFWKKANVKQWKDYHF